MTIITIAERIDDPSGANATISFDNKSEYSITINNPFSEEEEKRLEWYFEEYLHFPFTNKVKAQQVAESITVYGEKLFKQIFAANPRIKQSYKSAIQAGLNTLHIEIAGSPAFHGLHWETLEDPELPQPLALHASIVRKNISFQPMPAGVLLSPTLNLLIVVARPYGKQDVGYRTISQSLVEILRQTDVPTLVNIDILRPGTYKALENHLQEVTAKHGVGYYHVIHFDLHGALLSYNQLRYLYQKPRDADNSPISEGVEAFLFFDDPEDDRPDPVEASELANMLKRYQIPIAILNACQSGKQMGDRETSLGSRLMQAGVQTVLAMSYSVTVSAAKLLMSNVYQQLFTGQNLSAAITYARTQLYKSKKRKAYFNETIDLEDWLLPVVYQNHEQTLHVRPFTQEESANFTRREASSYAPPLPRYGFVGRDLDVLQLEKRLLTRHNIVLMRGMAGVGKSTLLQYLGWWWQITGFVEQVFFFGYDEHTWTCQQILNEIARKLLSEVQYNRDFQHLSFDAQQALLTKRLRTERHLLVLDNLESITGAQLATLHTLPLDEQSALHRFLSDLTGGPTLVLLGSRSGETWLAQGTFEDNVYELSGLDLEATSMLADRILEKYNATKYREAPDLLTLLKLLDGFPLALEVVLANLGRQTPKEVLEALLAGATRLDTEEGQKKSESLLSCIDYSYCNLSPKSQRLLACLAPFTSVFNLNLLDQYTFQLHSQPALATLPFECWSEVLQEAENWGLLSPHPDILDYMRMQPILPYYLRKLLDVPDQANVKHDVNIAFGQCYDEVGDMLFGLLTSKDPQEQHKGKELTRLEYQNLISALNMALTAHGWIHHIYPTLHNFLNDPQDQQRGLELSQTVLAQIETYQTDNPGYNDALRAHIIMDIAIRQSNLKKYQAAESSYQRALNLLMKSENMDQDLCDDLKATIYLNLGVVFEEQRQWTQAKQYYQHALQIRIKLNNLYSQANIYHHLGMVAQEEDQRTLAIHYYELALQNYIESGESYRQAQTYFHLGKLAQEARLWIKAEIYYRQALQICIAFKDYYNQGRIYHQMGLIAQEQGLWEQAEKYYQQALQIWIEFNDRYFQATTYLNLGVMAHGQQQWLQAREYFLHAYEIFMAYKDRHNSDIVLHNLARLWQTSNDPKIPHTLTLSMDSTPEEMETLLRDINDGPADEIANRT